MNKNEQNIDMVRKQGRGEHELFAFLRAKTLSEKEKETMWRELQISINRLKTEGVSHKNPQMTGLLALFMNRSFALSAFSIALVIGSGFSVARAAENALPGQPFYPVKINVNEPIIGSFKRSDTARADWERERAGRRIAEAETLAEEGKLGMVEKAEIEQQLSLNRRALEEIEGHTITDDEFFPQQIEGETQKINVRVEHGENEAFVHIEERLEKNSDEAREKESGIIDEEDHDTSFGGYTEKGMKIKNEKKESESDSKLQTGKQSSSVETLQKENDEKISPSEKNDSSNKQDSNQNNSEQQSESSEQRN